MLISRRLSLVTRVFPQLFCRTISVSRVAEKAFASSSSTSSSSSLVLSSSESSSSAGESCSEAEDGEESGVANIQVLRAYLRNRRSRCLGRVREQGLVPAVLCDADKERRPQDGSTDVFLSLDAKPLVALLKLIGKRDFVSRVFDMNIFRSPSSLELHESLQVLPRNLNYGPGKTNILNIQFVRAPSGQNLKLGVPLEFLGLDQCPGLKKGGTLKKLAKYVVYSCKASELPAKMVVDMSVLEIGDRVQVQDLEVDFDLLHSDRTMAVCEIVKDVTTLKAKARKLKTEIHYKKKALSKKESGAQAHALTEDEVEVSDDDEDEVIPYRYQKQRAAQKEASTKKAAEADEKTSTYTRAGTKRTDAKTSRDREVMKSTKPSKRRLTGTSFVPTRKEKLDEEAEQHNVSLSMKKHKVYKGQDAEDVGALPSFTRKQASGKNKVSGGGSGHRDQREQQGVLSSSKKYNSDSEDEDEVMLNYTRKRTSPKALASRNVFGSDSDSDSEDEASTRYPRKAAVRRRAFGVRS